MPFQALAIDAVMPATLAPAMGQALQSNISESHRDNVFVITSSETNGCWKLVLISKSLA